MQCSRFSLTSSCMNIFVFSGFIFSHPLHPNIADCKSEVSSFSMESNGHNFDFNYLAAKNRLTPFVQFTSMKPSLKSGSFGVADQYWKLVKCWSWPGPPEILPQSAGVAVPTAGQVAARHCCFKALPTALQSAWGPPGAPGLSLQSCFPVTISILLRNIQMNIFPYYRKWLCWEHRHVGTAYINTFHLS